jgi:hypothetical protein
MHRRPLRRVLTAAGMGAAGLLLAGCESPQPSVTAFSGTNSTRVEASCWTADESASSSCQFPGTADGSLPVRAGATVGIPVDAEVAEAGWVPAIGNQPLVQSPIEDRYHRITLDEQQVAQGALQVFALTEDNQLRGAWVIGITSD